MARVHNHRDVEEEEGGLSPGQGPWPHPPRWKLIQIAQHAMRKTRSRGKKKREGGVGAEANEHRVPQSNWILEGRAELKRPINLQCKKSSH